MEPIRKNLYVGQRVKVRNTPGRKNGYSGVITQIKAREITIYGGRGAHVAYHAVDEDRVIVPRKGRA